MCGSLTIFCLVQLSIVLSVEGVSMIINPSSMVVGSSSAIPVTQLELKCLSDGTDNIETVYRLEISRKRFSDSEFVDIAAVDDYKITTNFPQDMRSPNATGSILHSTPVGPPTSGVLIVTMDAGSLTCSDQAEFRCTMTYNMKGKAASPVSQSRNFTVITAPNDVQITEAHYEENGVMRRLENDKSYKVGTRIMYKCSANIGSDASLLITWERSSVMGGSTHFVPYIPAESSDIVQDPVISTNCFNHRTSSMYYNLTNSDSDGITFQCKVRSLLSNDWYESTSVPRRVFTVHALGGIVGEKANGLTASEAGVIAGAVIGSVVFVVLLIILIYYFMCYRKGSNKEPPRTTEEVESLDPPATGNIYTRPEKKKRTNIGAKVDGRKAPGSTELEYADLVLSKQPRPIPRKSKAKDPPVLYTEIRFNNS